MSGKNFYEDVEIQNNALPTHSEVDPSLLNQPSGLTDLLHNQRLAVLRYVETTKDTANRIVTGGQKIERDVSRKVASLYTDPQDRLIPGLAWIATAMMTGAILTRRMNIGLQVITPLVFGVASTSYILPSTYITLKERLYDFENSHFPDVVAYQDSTLIQMRRRMYLCRRTAQDLKSWRDDVTGKKF